MRFSCCVLLYVTKLEEGAQKRTPWGSWSPRTPRVGCVLGTRTPHEFIRMIVRLDSSKVHLTRNRKIGPGWISYSRMGAFFPKISIQLLPNILFSGESQPAFLVAHFLIRCQYLTISVDSGYCSLYILDVMHVPVRYSGYCWYWEYCGTIVCDGLKATN